MKKRALACLLLISIGLQPIASVLATEAETPIISSEEKETEITLERPLDTMTQELLESEPTSEETPTETTDSIDEPEAPIDIEPPAPTPETLSAPRAVTTVPWGQTICTIEGVANIDTGYTITVRAGSGTVAGTPNQAPWKTDEDYKTYTKKIIFDGSGGKIQLVGDQSYLFEGLRRIGYIDFSGVDTSQVTNMSGMFNGCGSLTNLVLNSFDTRAVTSMSGMFNECSRLINLDVSHFDTSRVTNMSNMFKNCRNLSSLNVSHFDTRQVTNMSSMFFYCQSLTDIDVSSFSTGQITQSNKMAQMFGYCTSLVRLDLSSLVISKNVSGLILAHTDSLKWLKLGSQTCLKTAPMNPPQNNLYTGKWVTVGNGTEQFPQGAWSGNAKQLSQRSLTGVADTYVWEPRKYTINFHANGGSNAPNPIVDYIDKAIDLTNLATPTPPTPFYEFIGWSTVINNPSTIVSSLTIPTNNVTLYANWGLLTTELTTVPDCFVFSNEVTRNEYTSQIISLSESAYGSKADFQTKWRGILDWKLTVTMAEWCNPDDATDTLTGVQMFMNNQFTRRNGSPAPSTVHSNQQVVLNAGETQTLVTTTTGNSADGMGSWQSTIDFDSVKLKIPRYGGREGSYYTSQLTWSLDDTI